MRVCIFGGVKQKESVVVLWSDSVWKIYWVAAVKKKQHGRSHCGIVLLASFCYFVCLLGGNVCTLELRGQCQVALTHNVVT